jgi:protein-S-isoprenylcysteine O-methyltransferase Ste14
MATTPKQSLAARAGYIAYGLGSYVAFLATTLYAVGFVGNFWPTLGFGTLPSMDVGRTASLGEALLIDAALLALFAVQHSTMARSGFKRWWTRYIPEPLERSTFVLAASLCLALLFWQWRPIGSEVWNVSQGAGAYFAIGVSLIGWAIVVLSTFMIDHAELFGLRQVWSAVFGRSNPSSEFRTPGFYRFVRHPLYFGFLLAFWATPVMTVGHLLFAALSSGYILVGIWLEERDLVSQFGDTYRAYRRRVRALVPIPRRER